MPLSWRLAGRLASRPVARGSGSSVSPSSTPLSWSVSRSALRRQQQRSYSSGGGSTGNKDKVKFWPFIAVIAVGSAGYIGLVNRRKGMPPQLFFVFHPSENKFPNLFLFEKKSRHASNNRRYYSRPAASAGQIFTDLLPLRHHCPLRPRRPRRRQGHTMRQPRQAVRLHPSLRR